MPPKRPLSSSANSDRSPKRVHAVPDEDEESLDAILARINEQEESERLAQQLHEQWNGSLTNESTSHAQNPGSSSQAVIVIDDSFETDEAFAHRLAGEWDQTRDNDDDSDDDVVFVGSSVPTFPPAAVTKPSSSKLKGKATARFPSKPVQEQPPVDETLAFHRELFTNSRSCTKCGKIVEAPRGLVCIGYFTKTALNNYEIPITGDLLAPSTTTEFAFSSSCILLRM